MLTCWRAVEWTALCMCSQKSWFIQASKNDLIPSLAVCPPLCLALLKKQPTLFKSKQGPPFGCTAAVGITRCSSPGRAIEVHTARAQSKTKENKNISIMLSGPILGYHADKKVWMKAWCTKAIKMYSGWSAVVFKGEWVWFKSAVGLFGDVWQKHPSKSDS